MYIPTTPIDETININATTPAKGRNAAMHRVIRNSGSFAAEDAGRIGINLERHGKYLGTAPIIYRLPGTLMGNTRALCVTATKGNLQISVVPIKAEVRGNITVYPVAHDVPVIAEPVPAGSLSGLLAEDGQFETVAIELLSRYLYNN